MDVPYHDADAFRRLVQVREGDPLTHQNFLSKFKTLRKFYLNETIIKRIVRETAADAADENIRYLELRFTPVALTRLNKAPLGEAMDWVIEASQDATREYGILIGLIASVNRHEDLSLAEGVAQLAVDRIDQGIFGLDLAGSEATHPGGIFAGLFKSAREAGLNITIHGGEWLGAESVRLAIEKLNAQRIGHGVRIMEDPAVVALAKEKGMVFEVCPTSNYHSGVTPSLVEHPLADMLKAGLNVTINTDDPSISQIDLSDEIELVCETLGVRMSEVQKAILVAARAAFLPEDKKAALVSSIEKEFTLIKNGNL